MLECHLCGQLAGLGPLVLWAFGFVGVSCKDTRYHFPSELSHRAPTVILPNPNSQDPTFVFYNLKASLNKIT